jgi:hypothetical protein
MAFSHGSASRVYVGGFDLSAYFNGIGMEASVDAAEVTTFGLGAKAYIPGPGDGTVSAEGFFDGAVDAVDQVLSEAMPSTAIWTWLPGGDGQGNVAKCAVTVQTSYGVDAPSDDATTISAEGQATGTGIERGVVAHPLQERTASGNGMSLDHGVSTEGGGAAYLHVMAVSGFSSVTVKVQHSADNVTFVDKATFDTVTARGAQRVVLSGTVNRYVRVIWTAVGSGVVRFAAVVVRRPTVVG